MRNLKEKILVVDDTPHNLRLLVSLLSQEYDVLVASSGPTALVMAEETLPDLILLDVMMPDMDGFEVCRKLKADHATSNIPVIFLTVFDGLPDKLAAFRVGGVDYITKPFQMKEVLARVDTHLTIRRLQQRLELQINELDAFAHTVAHDLLTPLSLIQGFADLLVQDYDELSSHEIYDYLGNIQSAGEIGIKIVRELLLLASIHKKDPPFTPVDMPSVVNRAISRLNQAFPNNQPEIIQTETWPMVIGYEPWLEEVWVNYLSNAYKYCGPNAEICCGMTPLGEDRFKFWVQDNGPGISDAEQKGLFIEFNQPNAARKEGYGLGLSIVQRIISRLGGEVGVESQLGKGSIFFFILPLR